MVKLERLTKIAQLALSLQCVVGGWDIVIIIIIASEGLLSHDLKLLTVCCLKDVGAIVLRAPILEVAALYVNDKPLGTISQV
jgi:hypothetical protein